LTRVTRIFQKSVFTETTPVARAGCRAGLLVARTQAAAAQGVFSRENQKRRSSHAVSEGRTRKSGRPRAARNWVTVLVQDLLAAVAAGDLTPSQGADLADVIDVYVRARAATSFEERLAKLEGAVDRRRARPPTPASRRQSAAVGNDRWVRSIVFGLLFTMKRATPTC
jgi:hypothetical protein